MARPEIPDTSALLEAVRRPDRWTQLQRSLFSGRVWLSSVVMAELYAWQVMVRRVRLHGALQPRDHLADVLILISAARLHGVVVTANLRHFEPWCRLAVAAGLDVAVRSSTAEP